jgi:hypothetical protein
MPRVQILPGLLTLAALIGLSFVGCSDEDPAPSGAAGSGGASGAGGTGALDGGQEAASPDADEPDAGEPDGGEEAGVEKTCADATNPALAFGPSESVSGATKEEWLEKWWEWTLNVPKTGHPNLGGACDQGQDGPVWMLGGTAGEDSIRECTVPADLSIFVPAASVLAWLTPEDDCGCMEVDCIKPMVEEAVQLEKDSVCLEVDGVSVGPLEDYLTWSEGFGLHPHETDPWYSNVGPYGPNNCGATEGDPRLGVAWGYAVVLKPLTPGQHTIRLFDVAGDGSGFAGEVTYQITVP